MAARRESTIAGGLRMDVHSLLVIRTFVLLVSIKVFDLCDNVNAAVVGK